MTEAPDGTYTAIATGNLHSCALRSDGTIACWGMISPATDPPDGTYVPSSLPPWDGPY